jgi:hypothetical protein
MRKKAATGEGCRCATKPLTPRLAAVEAAEQAQKLRVVGGGGWELAGVGKEAAGEERIEGRPVPLRHKAADAAAGRGGGGGASSKF